MKQFLLVGVSLFSLLCSQKLHAGEPVTIYAVLLENAPVQLSNGSEWNMDKGDCFPIIAYKESRNKVILKLESAQFMVDAKLTREVKDSELATALEKYRANVKTFLTSETETRAKKEEKPSETVAAVETKILAQENPAPATQQTSEKSAPTKEAK